jgi:hypothetical protein
MDADWMDLLDEKNKEIKRLQEQAHYHYENGLKKDVEIERLRKDYALAWENHLLHEQIFVLTEAKIERLQEALVEIVYQIGQGNIMAAMDIAAPIAAAYLQQKEGE